MSGSDVESKGKVSGSSRQWRIQAGRPLRTKFFLISCSFWENLYIGAFPWRAGAPPPTGNPGSAPGRGLVVQVGNG